MAKYLVPRYTFNPSTDTVVVNGIYRRERFLLITNVTTNQTIYTFNDDTQGISSYSVNNTAETTTLVLDYDCSAMSSTDKLQIFVELDSVDFSPAETFVDPVSKIRVSQPENLIDTDFEYGLQSTKWETLELVKNIPTFFARNGDEDLSVTAVESINGSDIISVTCDLEHNLIVGSPIIVQGTKSISANGAFVVTSAGALTFQYKSKNNQNFTGSILDTYTQIFPGSVYQGTEFKLSNISSVTTDGSSNSTITVNTEFPTDFTSGTSFFLTNSVSTSVTTTDSTQAIPENYNSISASVTNNTATGENGFTLGATQVYQYTGSEQVVYFTNTEVTVNTTAETIQFPSAHGFPDNTPFLYVVGEGNGAIGGLSNYTGYFVRTVDANTIYLTTTRGSTTRINLTAAGTDGGVNRSAFIRAYKMVSANTTTGQESITFDENHGLSSFQNQPVMFFNGTASSLSSSTNLITGFTLYYPHTLRSATTMSWSATSGGALINLTGATATAFMIKVNLINERSSMYFANHGLADNDVIVFTANSGTPPGGLTTATTYKVEFVSTSRIRFKNNDTSAVITLSSIGTNNGQFTIETRTPNLDNDSLYTPGSSLTDGSALVYTDEGGTTIGGLTDGGTYYVFQKTTNRIKLATTVAGWKTSLILISQSVGVNTTTNVITTQSAHGFTTGDAVQYISATPISGLVNGAWYWVRSTGAATCTLHWSKAGATGNTDIVDLAPTPTGTGSLRTASLVDITSAGTGEHKLQSISIGGSDGVYSLTSKTSDTAFTLATSAQIPQRQLIVSNPTQFIDLSRSAINYVDHYMTTGTPIVFTTDGVAPGGLTASTTYYVIRVNRDWFRLAATQLDAVNNDAITITSAGNGGHVFTTSSISGEVLGAGTFTIASGTTSVSGSNTNFSSTFSPGDTFVMYANETLTNKSVSTVNTTSNIFTSAAHGLSDGAPVKMNSATAPTGTTNGVIYYIRSTGTATPANEFTLHPTYNDAIAGTNTVDVTTAGTSVAVQHLSSIGSTTEIEIRYVNSKTNMVLREAVPTAFTSAEYAIGTALLLRADGFALHRPYDGGVELIPSTNPDSTMIRQTRKYFRYQSGKGIQVSFAVNFSPTTTFDTVQVIEDTDKVTKCRRDIGYFIDGVGYDITLGTNYNARFLGFAESNSLDISARVIEAIEDSRDEILALPAVSGDVTSTSRVNSFYTELLNIVNNGREAASAISFTNPSNATTSRIAAKDKLLANIDFIEEEINAYVAFNYPNYDHDVSKCSRDIKYAVHAMCYDILYGGNSATYDQAKFFLYSYANGAFGIVPEHITQTVAAYQRLADIIDDIATGTLITKTSGNTLTQVTSGNNADAGDAATLVTLAEITRDTIDNAEVPAVTRTAPNVSWAADALESSKTAIDAAKETIKLTVVPSSIGFLTATGTTRYPHRLTPGLSITIAGASGTDADLFNGVHTVSKVLDDYTFQYSLDSVPSNLIAPGVVEYSVNGWQNSKLKCGLFDDQNGLFFEYDGQQLYCVRRSSTLQLSGTVSVSFKSGRVEGTNTKFTSQLQKGDKIVIKGQTYLISKISSNTLLFILPSYRGVDATNVIITKTVDTKVPQTEWSIDPCDGTGPLGYVLGINKIQMAYMDYSWYGAGKVRFGFKNQAGQVVYVHEFVHNNKQTEAYMRSGNLPARYEIENTGAPTYVPALAHWGTSVIMDGRFDDDKAYVFTANSNTVSIVGVAQQTVSARVETQATYQLFTGTQFRQIGFALLVGTANSQFNSISSGLAVSGTGLQANTLTALPQNNQISPRQPYLASVDTVINNNIGTRAARTLLVIDRQPTATAGANSSYTVTLSASTTPVVYDVPLISIRLAPSVDTNTPGYLGEREIINRMQLILQSVGVLSTHSAEITLLLNGQINNNNWERVNNPSLSQLIYHGTGDTISGGTVVFSFRAQGGTGTTARSGEVTTADLGDIATLGNSILGGDGTYPDGPDILTLVAKLIEDPSTVSSTNPFNITGRISWSESQA